MQLLINIPKDDFEYVKENSESNRLVTAHLYKAVAEGEVVERKREAQWVPMDKLPKEALGKISLAYLKFCSNCYAGTSTCSPYCANCGAKMD